jgi:hypothetical protein
MSRRLLAPDRRCAIAFFVTFFLGLAALSWSGRALSAVPLEGVARFHRFINADTFFYPTLAQVIALARLAATDQQTLVIVGGNSVMYGAAQGPLEVWTSALQDQLGATFGVVNLAFPAGMPGEHGGLAAQALIREGRPLIYVTQVYPSGGDPDGLSYRYVFWEARSQARLLSSPERDETLAQSSRKDTALADARSELRIRAELDRVLHFTDLWQTIGYRYAFTLWQPFVPPDLPFWAPRRLAAEPVPPIFPPALRYSGGISDAAMRVVQRQVDIWCAQSGDTWRYAFNESYWTTFHASLNAQIPHGLRERTVAQILPFSPYYVKHLPDSAQACLSEAFRAIADLLRSDGYHVVMVGQDWTEDDYFDHVHPSGEGGVKMAAELAPHVRTVADDQVGLGPTNCSRNDVTSDSASSRC